MFIYASILWREALARVRPGVLIPHPCSLDSQEALTTAHVEEISTSTRLTFWLMTHPLSRIPRHCGRRAFRPSPSQESLMAQSLQSLYCHPKGSKPLTKDIGTPLTARYILYWYMDPLGTSLAGWPNGAARASTPRELGGGAKSGASDSLSSL